MVTGKFPFNESCDYTGWRSKVGWHIIIKDYRVHAVTEKIQESKPGSTLRVPVRILKLDQSNSMLMWVLSPHRSATFSHSLRPITDERDCVRHGFGQYKDKPRLEPLKWGIWGR
jgi:hypothetical protein